MRQKYKVFLVGALTILFFIGSINSVNMLTKDKLLSNEKVVNNAQKIVPIDNEVLENPPETVSGPIERISPMGSWTSDPGDWWDTDWEYRINITVTEPNIADRTDWPVEVFLNFHPPAHKYSIRVYDVTLGTLISYQIDNVTYADSENNYVDSATISFLVTLSEGESRVYQIYWSPTEKQIQFYDKIVNYDEESTPNGPKYTISKSDDSWIAITDPSKGGKVAEFIVNGEHLENDVVHFGITFNSTTNYGGYKGTANLDNTLWDSLYIENEQDSLTQLFAGVVSVTYVIKDAKLYDPDTGTQYGNATIKYIFYNWGFIVKEELELGASTQKRSFIIGGWVFDQDDGIGDSRFNYVYDTNGATEMATNLLESGSGTIPETNNYTLYDESSGKPYYRIYKVYLGADSYTLHFDDVGSDDASDEMWIMVIAPDGETTKVTWSYYEWGSHTGPDEGGPKTFTVNAGEEGYYYILVMIKGDDNHNEQCEFHIWLDDSSGTTIWDKDSQIVYTPDPTNPGNQDNDRITVDEIELIDIYLGPTTNGVIEVSWSSSTYDVDVALLDENSTFLGHNCSRGGTTKATFLFNNSAEGHLTLAAIVYDSAPGNVVNLGIDYTITSKQGAEWLDYENTGNFNYTTFLNNRTGYLVGIGYLNFQIDSAIKPTNTSMWYNEGDDVIDGDYIFWGLNITFNQVPVNNRIMFEYMILGTKASPGAPSAVFNYFNKYYQMKVNDVVITKGVKERFHLPVTITVQGADMSIPNVNVSLVNSTSNIEYSGYTNSSGEITFTIERKWFNITLEFSDLGRTYKSYIVKDFSKVEYSTLTYSITATNFSYLVRFTLKTYTNTTPKTLITGGDVILDNTTWTLNGKTNDSGVFEGWLPKGTWTFEFNATATTPEDYDNVTLYYTNWTKWIGPGRSLSITFTSSIYRYLLDHDITTAPTPTELVLYNTPSTFSVYWLENITIQIDFYETEHHTKIDGTVYWYLMDSNDVVLYNGSKQTSFGRFTLQVNTSNLSGDNSYHIKFNATPSSSTYDKPAPIAVFLDVKDRLTSLDATFNPSQEIYWNTELEIIVEFKDAIYGSAISGADVYMKIQNSTYSKEVKVNETGQGTYKIDDLRNIIVLDAGTYTITIKANKTNYVSKEKTYTLTVDERPTDVTGPAYINTPWVETYQISIKYEDLYYATPQPIENANVIITVNKTSTGTIVEQATMKYQNGEYVTTLNISSANYGLGTFIITITANKNNYKSQTYTITLEIRARKTQLLSNTTRVTLIYGYSVEIGFTYQDLDTANNNPISGATLSGQLYLVGAEGNVIKTYNLDEIGSTGQYNLTFNTEGLKLGTYILVVTGTKDHYQDASTAVTIVIKAIPTTATPDKTQDSREWGENITIMVVYNRTDLSQGVGGADNHTYVITGGSQVIEGQLIDYNNGTYMFQINSSRLGVGTYTLTIYLEKAFHENQTVVIIIEVRSISTFTYSDYSSITMIWSESTQFNVYYNRSKDHVGIGGASITATLKDVDTGQTVGSLSVVPIQPGVYRVTIDSTAYTVGSYYIQIELLKANYTSQTVIVTLTINPVPTISLVNSTDVSIYWGEAFVLNYTYYRTDLGQGVAGATAIYYVEDVTKHQTYEAVTKTTNSNGYILIEFNSSNYNPGVYILHINSSLANYEMASVSVNVKVSLRPVTVALSQSTVTMVWGDKVNLSLTIKDALTDESITDVSVVIDPNPNSAISILGESNGTIIIGIDSTKLNETMKSYPIFIYIEKTNYEPKTIGFSLTVNPVDLEIRVTGQSKVILNPVTGGTTTYKVGVYDKSRGGIPVSNATVSLIVKSGNQNYTVPMKPIEGEPGQYEATINWASIPIFKPGQRYTIEASVENLNINGATVPVSAYSASVTGTTDVSVDYYGGSTDVPLLGRVPALLFYPVVIVILVIGSVIGYRVVMYMRLPEEVKEIDKLVKMLEKGIYEYEAPSREDIIRELIEGEMH
ncbi:MAG: MSCRAMM family protein [Candidatus Njordarchaeia archaeon]